MSKIQPETTMKPAEKITKRVSRNGHADPARKNGHAENGKKPAPKNANPRTIGTVPDLERHLPSDWWRSLFNSVYLKTDGDVVENYNNTVQEVDLLIRAAGLEKSDRILDLCCGQGRHSLELARQGFANV